MLDVYAIRQRLERWDIVSCPQEVWQMPMLFEQEVDASKPSARMPQHASKIGRAWYLDGMGSIYCDLVVSGIPVR